MSDELGKLIAARESGTSSGELYASQNKEVPPDERCYFVVHTSKHPNGDVMDLPAMTVDEIYQRQLPHHYDHNHHRVPNPHPWGAAGKYQLTHYNIQDLRDRCGLDLHIKFTPANQETIYADYMLAKQCPHAKAYILGKHDHTTLLIAQREISIIWATVQDPDTGASRYKNNRATITPDQVKQALNTMSTEYQRAIHNGATPENAWREVTGRAPVTTKTIDPPAHSASAAMSPTDSDHRNPPGQSNNLGFQLDPDVQRILDAMHSGDPTRIDAAFGQNMENHFASPQGQSFRLDVQAQAQQMQQGQEQAAQQQEVQQQSGPTRGMSR
jgi:muramidase (phage lysozyme)